VAMVGGDEDGGLDGVDADIAVVGVDGDGGGGGKGEGEVGSGAVERGHGEGDGVAIGGEFRVELLGACVSLGVGSGIDVLFDGDVDLVIVAGAGDGDIAAGVVDGEAGRGGKCLGQGLPALM